MLITSRGLMTLALSPFIILLASGTRLILISNYDTTTATTMAASGSLGETLLGTVIPLLPPFLPHFLLSSPFSPVVVSGFRSGCYGSRLAGIHRCTRRITRSIFTIPGRHQSRMALAMAPPMARLAPSDMVRCAGCRIRFVGQLCYAAKQRRHRSVPFGWQ
jgi:hypothetical protein